jgi:hypothetical protein
MVKFDGDGSCRTNFVQEKTNILSCLLQKEKSNEKGIMFCNGWNGVF